MQSVYGAGIGVYPCRGNHDAAGVNPAVDSTGALSKAAWNNVFSRAYALPNNGMGGEENVYGYILVEVDGLEVTLTWKQRTAPGVFVAGGDVFTYTSACDSGTSPCTIEAIYGENEKNTKTIRNFRDDILRQIPEGQEIIRLYYQWSPVVVKAMEEI